MDYKDVKLYRKRYMPDENIWLKDDEILYIDDSIIITKWKTLKPRPDFDHGCSCVYIKEGIKISRFYDTDHKLLYNYCDIIETRRNGNSYVFYDLLADVIIYENSFVKVVDIGEIADAMQMGIITIEQAQLALKTLDKLLDIIYKGNFSELLRPLEEIK